MGVGISIIYDGSWDFVDGFIHGFLGGIELEAANLWQLVVGISHFHSRNSAFII